MTSLACLLESLRCNKYTVSSALVLNYHKLHTTAERATDSATKDNTGLLKTQKHTGWWSLLLGRQFGVIGLKVIDPFDCLVLEVLLGNLDHLTKVLLADQVVVS